MPVPAGTLSPEDLALLRELSGMAPDPTAPLPAPDPDFAYRQQAQNYLGQAGELERQAAQPMVRPKGTREHVVNAARAFLEGFARPQDPFAESRRRQDIHLQGQQDLVERARALRAEAAQQQGMGETAKLRAIQESAEQRAERESRQPNYINITSPKMMKVGPDGTSEIIDTGFEPQSTRGLTNWQRERKYLDGNLTEIIMDMDPDSDTLGREYARTADGRIIDVTGKTTPYVAPQTTVVQTMGDEGPGFYVVNKTARSATPVTDPTGEKLVPKPDAGTGQRQDENTSALQRITTLGSLFKDEFVGPYSGRGLSFASKWAPEALYDLPEGYEEFAAVNAALKNDMIRLITGAQMSEGEAKRILSQVPAETDRSDMWRGKYAQTLARARVLKALIDRRVGASTLTLEQLDAIASGQAAMPEATTAAPAAAPQQAPRAPVSTKGWSVRPKGR